MAQLALGVVGGAIGAYFGPVGAQIGYVIGSYIGGSLGPAEQRHGPRLSDLKAPTAGYGAVIPYVEGHPRVAGAIAWQSDKREIATTTSSGKGGPAVDTTNYTYEVDVLYILSENQIAGVRRIWSNGELVWTAADDSDDQSIIDSASVINWRRMTVYTGDAAQLPDPIYEAAFGAGNVPANRGRGSIFFEGLNCGSTGQFPLLTFELTSTEPIVYSTDIFYAPLTTDRYDTISPIANSAATGSAAMTHSSDLGVTFTASALETSVQLVYGDNSTADKLDSNDAAYVGEKLTFSCHVTLNSWGGNDLTYVGFMSYSNGMQNASFEYVTIGGAVLVSSYLSYGGTTRVNHGVFVDGVYSIVFGADGTTITWMRDEEVLRTATIAGRYYGRCFLYTTYRSGYNVLSMTFKELRFYKGEYPVVTNIYPLASAPLNEVIERQCERAGLDLAYVDASALSALEVRAMALSQIVSPRQVIDMLAGAYHFEATETPDLTFVLRGGPSAVTIDYADMGAAESADGPEPMPITRANDIELPAQVTVKFMNVDDDYQDGAEASDRMLTGSSIVQTIEYPLGLTPTEAKRIADVAVTDAAASITRVGPVMLSRRFAAYVPTDVVTLTGHDGSTFRVRWTKKTEAAGILTFEGVLDNASAMTSTAATSGDYTNSTEIRRVYDTVPLYLDIPILRDVDDDPGFYAAAKGSPYGSVLYSSIDDVTYTEEVTIPTQSVFGTCLSTLPDWTGPHVFDEVSSLTVDVGSGTLASSTRAAMLADQAVNACAIGVDGRWELCQFRDATLVSAGVYTLTGWLRGARGTEWASVDHVAAETFAMLTTAGLRRVAMQQSEIGVEEYWKGVTVGRQLTTAAGELFSDDGVGQKPFAPVDLRKGGDDTAVVVTWKRRTRLAPRFVGTGGINVPLGETSESYDVDLYDDTDTLVSSTTVTEPEWTAPSAETTGNLLSPVSQIQLVGGELVGISAPEGSALHDLFFNRHTTAGAGVDQGPRIGHIVYQWTNDGDNLYACTADIYDGVPQTYANSKIKLYARTDLDTLVASYTAPTAGDLHGVAHDGSNIWVTEYYGGNLRKLHGTTLASVATYALDTGMERLKHYSGSLWIVAPHTNEVIEWGISGTAELQRFSVVDYPQDLLLVGSNLFVMGSSQVGIYVAATGALVATVDAPNVGYDSGMFLFDGDYVAVYGGAATITLIDAVTGEIWRSFSTRVTWLGNNYTGLYHLAGVNGDAIYATVGASGHSNQTLAFKLAAPALTGYSLVVYQNSANVGRGYPATLEL